MVSSENCMYVLSDEEIKELDSLRINAIRICPLYDKALDNLRLIESENFYKELIRKAHNEGWAVFLEINIIGPSFSPLSDPKWINDIYDIASHWAEIAEKEDVEFYSPLNEPNFVFSDKELVNKWINESQDLRPLFSGNLVLKLADVGPEKIENISNYDYLAFDIIWSDSRYDELRNYLSVAITKGNSIKHKYNLKGFIFGELGAEKSRVDENVQAEIFRTILNETWGKIDGYCFLGWSDLEFSFKSNEKAKNIIRNWYSLK